MQPVADLLNTKMDLTSDICRHETFVNGKSVVKEIKMIKFDGEVVCPICETEAMTEELREQEQTKADSYKAQKDYKIFHNQNVITDINLLNASFGNYETSETEEIANKERAVTAYQKLKNDEVFNIWLTGHPGVGKSHLAMSILRNLNETGEKNRSCLFVSVDEMLLRIRDSFNNHDSKYTEGYFVDLLSSVDFLVLDDLGAETGGTGTTKKATDFTLRVLYAIANSRQNKSTIVTTNLSRDLLIKMYDPKLISRLMKDTYLIKFEQTKDKRIKNIDF